MLAEVFDFLDLPRLEHGPGDLEHVGEHNQLAFQLPTILKHDEHDPAVLREHRRVEHVATVGAVGDMKRRSRLRLPR